MDKIRKSAIAGSWYPGKPAALKKDITEYFDKVPDLNLSADVEGLIAPHAGYIYSGQVAAYAYKLVLGRKYDAVVVVGPSHRVAFRGVSVFSQGGYETPLGIVPVDESLAGDIKKAGKNVEAIPTAHTQEHSVEIQLPFLQVALGNFSFVPLVMGDQSEQTCADLAEAIYRASRELKILIVGSSDLSHFHNYLNAVKLDAEVLKYLQDGNAGGLLTGLENDTCEACGGGPMAVAMMVAQKRGASNGQVLKYLNSGDITGDKSSVVGYVSAAFYH